jgi:ABC-2 type transport system ATP-binding protein
MLLQVENVTKIYGTQKAVDDISFSVNKGEIVGFLGPNGAGKSTTMKMITGFLQPDHGTIKVAGIDVTKNPIEAKKHIGYLSEANPLYYDMYVKEYLSFIAGVHGIDRRPETVDRNAEHVGPSLALGRLAQGVTGDRARQKVEEVITKVGLTIEAHKKIGQLSKGYKQRVGLAAAIMHEPSVLILDEPTSGLDPNQIIEIRQLIKEQGIDKTVLFSSHILAEVEALCERVIIINKGAIVANNSLANLKQDQSLEKVFHHLTTAVAG